MVPRRAAVLSVLALTLALSACAVGPDYQRPGIDVGTGYKEGQDKVPGWKPAQPGDTAQRGPWWTLYGDPVLNDLMGRLDAANQSIAAAEANYRQAQALVQGARAGFYPTVGVSADATRSGGKGTSSSNSSRLSSVSSVDNQYSLTGSVSWEADVWGKLRRTLEASRASAQASEADLAATRLSAQSTLAQTYFALRVMDRQKKLLEETIDAYQRSLQLTQNRYQVGVSGKSDVAVATTQLENTRAQSIDLDWQRSQLEHAIAVLTGQPPSQFSLPPEVFEQQVPEIPVDVPSALLERRPDVASAERNAAAANAKIGVAVSAWYPDLTLSADGGFRSSLLGDLLTVPARFWSIGPSLALTVFDGGARQSQVDQARAAYDAQAATYRQTVLTALKEVEDYLAQLRSMQAEQVVQNRALASARESLQLMLNQYKAGTVDYLSVATVQATALSTERSTLSLTGSRLTASVQLIAAMGGGWEGLTAR